MPVNRLEHLAADVRRLLAALEETARERDALRQRLQRLGGATGAAPTADAAAPPPSQAAAAGDEGLMEHVVMLESERAEIRERLSRLLRLLEEVDLGE